MSILLDCVFALSHSVPNFQVLVSTSTGNLSVVRGEGAGQHVSGVAHEPSAGASLLDIPKSQGSIPRGGQCISAILREGDIFNEVGMT